MLWVKPKLRSAMNLNGANPKQRSGKICADRVEYSSSNAHRVGDPACQGESTIAHLVLTQSDSSSTFHNGYFLDIF
jgi:hypothetical protein